uniref:uncharacterized protein LOC120330623 isoform X2 n=1 Tax=Styela clava TaxID=7725 RepID=UPI00193A5038|nr:uncharacterized protein LOC120330623 isoform X2 [Styela clava]
MATPDGRRVNRPYRKASEYLATKQSPYNGPKTIVALEAENSELREKLTTSVRRLETMEVEFEQSREYFATQLDVVQDKLNRTTQALKLGGMVTARVGRMESQSPIELKPTSL